jgi:transposase
MFSVSLELPEFEVVNQTIFSTYYLVHVEKKVDEERCPHCDFTSSSVHDRRTRKVRDLSLLNKPLYLLVSIKRYRCVNCDEVFTAFTNRFRQFIYEQVLGTTIKDASRKHKVSYSTVERIFYSIAQEKEQEHRVTIENLQEAELTLSLNEVAVRKRHTYETVLYDANLGAVIGMHQNRVYQSVLELFSSNVPSPETVKNVIVDMWDPFHKAVRATFPNAKLIVDKYHVVQKVTHALDQVRKAILGLKKARCYL